ncbi:MAG: hypothetical protein WCF67_17440 [Chitinophagaceae bacterium]
MPKSAIINLAREGLLEKVEFKKLALFFDTLYVDLLAFHATKWEVERSSKLSNGEKQIVLAELDWLCEIGFIKPYKLSREELGIAKLDHDLINDIHVVDKIAQKNIIPVKQNKYKSSRPGELHFAGVLKANNELIFKMEDIRMRIDAATLGTNDPTTEFIPIVNSFASYHRLQSTDFAAHFILGKFPVPDENTSWEQLLDFKKDEDIKRKYYSLIHWINEISLKNMPVSHLIDQYNQLYSEYTHQYSLHKLNSNFTTIELLMTAGIQFASAIFHQNFIAAFKDLLTIRKQQVTLLKSEKEVEGRELAYIFSANEQFSIV